jgi:hypothetical protein
MPEPEDFLSFLSEGEWVWGKNPIESQKIWMQTNA